MTLLSRRVAQRPHVFLVMLFVLAAVAEGCGSSNLDRVAEEQFPGFKKIKLGKLAGQVTVDGQLPAKDAALFVILSDVKNLDEAKTSKNKTPKLLARCDSNGKFIFSPRPGKYVISFVELRPATGGMGRGSTHKLGGIGGSGSVNQRFVGPDELQNLYNDPRKNSEQKDLNVDIQDPGRDDYQFNLVVAGKQPVDEPGPEAWTTILSPVGNW